MRSVKQLIEENNEKRQLLNEENERYYSDFLVYVRTDLRASEYETEEILMDLLDHLLEAQEAGKNAKDLFSDNPKAYAEELLAAIPNEKKRNIIQFVSVQLFEQLGSICILVGLILCVLSPFIEVKNTVHMSQIGIVILFVILTMIFVAKFIFHLVRSDVFQPKTKRRKNYLKAGLGGALYFILFSLSLTYIPDFGPKVQLNWWQLLVVGPLLLVLSYLMKRWNKHHVSY